MVVTVWRTSGSSRSAASIWRARDSVTSSDEPTGV
jgi:hypothetical protein